MALHREGNPFKTIASLIVEKYETTMAYGTIRTFIQAQPKHIEEKEEVVDKTVPTVKELIEKKVEKAVNTKLGFLLSIKDEIESSINEGIGCKKLKSIINTKYKKKITVGSLTNFIKGHLDIKKKVKTTAIKNKVVVEQVGCALAPEAIDVKAVLIAIKTDMNGNTIEANIPVAKPTPVPMPTKEAIAREKRFLALVKRSVPEGIEFNLVGLKTELVKKDAFFNTFKYGAKTLIALLRKFPDDISIEECGGYSPPIYKVILIDKNATALSAPIISSVARTDIPTISLATNKKHPVVIVQKASDKPLEEATPTVKYSPPLEDMSFTEELELPTINTVEVAIESLDESVESYLPDDIEEGNTYYAQRESLTLFQTHKFQANKEFFAVFKSIDFRAIAGFAEEEDWSGFENFSMKKKVKYGMLKYFLNRTFSRLTEEGKISYSDCNKRCCFNTGLLTNEQKEVFLLFTRENEQDKWVFDRPVDSYTMRLQHFKKAPEMVNFTSSPELLFFDTTYEIEINVKHIAEDNIGRFPDIFLGNKTLAVHAIVGAVEELKIKLRRDYSLAIPFYYLNTVQLFLPVDLLGDGRGMIALIADKDEARRLYRIRTVLPIEVAYGNARVIRKLSPLRQIA